MAFEKNNSPEIESNKPQEKADNLDLTQFETQKEKMQTLHTQEEIDRELETARAEKSLEENLQDADADNPDAITRTWKEFFWGTIETQETAEDFRKDNPELVKPCDDSAESIQQVAKYLPTEKQLFESIKQQTENIPEEKKPEATKYIAYMVRNWKNESEGVTKRREETESTEE